MDYPVLGHAPNVASATVSLYLDANGNGVPVPGGGASFSNITSGTTTIKTGAGILQQLIVNNPGTTVTATIYDNTAGSGTKIGTVLLVAGMSLSYGIAFSNGLTVVLSGACDLTISYR
jgi:hypothetical protein